MSENTSDVPVHERARHQAGRSSYRIRMPIQLNNPSQVSSNLVRMVSNMIPQLEQQINSTINEPEMADLAEMALPGHHPAPPLPMNPYLGARRGHGHSHGHMRSHSYHLPSNFQQQHQQSLQRQNSAPRRGHARNMSSHNASAQFHSHNAQAHPLEAVSGSGNSSGVSSPTYASPQQMPFHPAQQHAHVMDGNQHGGGNQGTDGNQQPAGTDSVNQNFVIDFGGGGGVANDPGVISDATPPFNVEDSNNNGRQATNSNNPLSNVRTIWKATQGIPFVILMLAKILYDHRLGILCLIGLFGTYYHANSSLKRQISQRDSHSIFDTLGNLCWIIVFLAANIIFIYYVFDDEKLYRVLYFQVPEFTHIDIWTLFWIVGVTDFVIKYATIMVKATVALLPKQVLPIKKKGKHYMLVEVISQFYRCLTPIIPWLLYLFETPHGGHVFAYVLCVLYVAFKANHVWGKAKELRKAFASFRLDVSYGRVPRREDLEKVDNICPICQDKLSDPVQLSCTHIFCEDCVSMWFDREKTCPMCRAQIIDNPMWRDGTTSAPLDMF